MMLAFIQVDVRFRLFYNSTVLNTARTSKRIFTVFVVLSGQIKSLIELCLPAFYFDNILVPFLLNLGHEKSRDLSNLLLWEIL